MRIVLDFQSDMPVASTADAWAAEQGLGLVVASDGTRLYSQKATLGRPALVVAVKPAGSAVHLQAEVPDAGKGRSTRSLDALLLALGHQPLDRPQRQSPIKSLGASIRRLRHVADTPEQSGTVGLVGERTSNHATWLDGYAGQTTEQLISLAATYRVDSVVLAFEQAIQSKAARVGLMNLSEPERVVLAVEAIEREVNNGGYDQLFINSSNAYAPWFVSSLNAIGRADVATLTQEAIDALGIAGPLTVEKVDAAMADDDEGRDERLGECIDRYFHVAGDLAQPLLDFLKANRAQVIL